MASPVKVERLTKNDLKDVIELVFHLCEKWRYIGLQLNMEPQKLQRIQGNFRSADDRLFQLIREWLNGLNPEPTWANLVMALRSKCVGEDTLAAKIEIEKEIVPEPVETLSVEEATTTSNSEDAAIQKSCTECGSEVFPYLKSATLTEIGRSALEGRLLNESFEVQCLFGDMVTDTIESLEAHSVTPSKLASVVMGYPFTQQLKEIEDPPKSFIRIQKELRSSKTLEDAFFVIFPYYSFFNYELIDKIIQRFGTDDDKRRLADYEKSFNEFCKRRVCECPSDAFDKEAKDDTQVCVKLKDEFENYTLKAVIMFHHKLCDLLGVPRHFLRFIGASEGCIELVFLLPSSLEELVFPLSDKQKESLKGEGVMQLKTDNYQYNLDQELDTTLSCASVYDGFGKSSTVVHLRPARPQGTSYATLFTDLRDTVIEAAKSGHTDKINELLKMQDTVIEAAKSGHTDKINELLKMGVDVNAAYVFGWTALMWAAMNGHTVTVQTLVVYGADMNIRHRDCWTALMLASHYGHTGTVRALVESGADMNIQDRDYWTALMLAARYGHTGTVRTLMTNGADIHKLDADGWTALMWAADNGHTDTVTALVAGGTDMDIQDEALQGLREVEETYEDVRYSEWASPNRIAFSELKNFFYVPTKMNQEPEEDGRTALMLAAGNGHTDTVQALVALGADMNIRDTNGRTALMLGALNGRTDVVIALVVGNADMNSQDKFGKTAIMFAARRCHANTVIALVTGGADIHIQDLDGMTALMLAARHGRIDVVNPLVAGGADVNTQDIDGSTALMMAALEGLTDTVQALVVGGADMNIQDNDGTTALILALHQKTTHNFETAKFLIEAGAVLSHEEKATGWSALFFAAKHGSLPLVKLLLERGADTTVKDKEGVTAYHVAEVYGHEDIMKAMRPIALTETLPESTTGTQYKAQTSSSMTQPSDTVQNRTIRERVFRAVKVLADRFEKLALPGRAKKKETILPIMDPDPEGMESKIIPTHRQRSNTPEVKAKKSHKRVAQLQNIGLLIIRNK